MARYSKWYPFWSITLALDLLSTLQNHKKVAFTVNLFSKRTSLGCFIDFASEGFMILVLWKGFVNGTFMIFNVSTEYEEKWTIML